tara:strand:+ start:387 stop:767 length:381 start_codon:yes stop_codon:yes gene_type:complete
MSKPLEVIVEKLNSLENKIDDSDRKIRLQIDNMLEHLLKSIENNTSANLSRSIAMNSGKKSKIAKASKAMPKNKAKKRVDEGTCGACKSSFKFENSFHKYHVDSDGSCKKLWKDSSRRVPATFIKN